ncbi:MAG: hypothetical protein ACLFMO_07705 [Eubacteriales bacterium]
MLKNLWELFKPILIRIYIFIMLIFILIIIWFAFIFLVGFPPINDTWTSLIMVWLTAVLLIISIFPNILNKIKRVKIKDFEIEMKEVIENSTEKSILSLSDFRLKLIKGKKGNLNNLKILIRKAILNPNKPLILIADLKQGENISIPMLFTYLFILNFVSKSVIVLFISSKSNDLNNYLLKKENIVGAIQGQVILDHFYKLFPKLMNVFSLFEKHRQMDVFFMTGNFLDLDYEWLLKKAREIIYDIDLNYSRYLGVKEVKQWFDINCRIIEFPLQNKHYKEIYNALLNDEKFITIYVESEVQAIVPLTDITKNVTIKTLKRFSRN